MAFNWFKKSRESEKKDDILTESAIVVGARARDKYEAIEIVGGLLVKEGRVDPSYIDAMKQREDLLTTYIGNGIAIPHGVGAAKEKIKKSGIAVAQFPEGVDFGDGNKAYIVIGIAAKGDEHLDILANIASACEDEKRVKKLVESKDPREVLRLLTEGFGK
ncbi:PTS sugar transporter subunit IIA [Thermosediminibacter litoriperuensis]|uniref:Mannitol-specific phosphotransferase enzyme IIA component n=1 Tax=Thermosediminibacter litoriperuensis TaxID=291989 RepID=A0A5S5AN17_9FIRM|nr:PTS sugar transporter subunit IIA [Thermosediminibacter litoriperuensis]TYP51669.1 PTS system D-mannitol-specific IIA component, Fru family (TC 4.A.2.1.2) [Thermosediminibacter litoriperuensis]